MRILFVCLGNICRSPTAEGVLRHLLAEAGLQDEVQVDSAGTGGWHVGAAPDERATATARRRGILLEGAARQVAPADFDRYDLILAMDAENLGELRRLAPSAAAQAKVRLLREYDPATSAVAAEPGGLDVPDPYYGGAGGFDDVLDLVESACRGLLEEIRRRRASTRPRPPACAGWPSRGRWPCPRCSASTTRRGRRRRGCWRSRGSRPAPGVWTRPPRMSSGVDWRRSTPRAPRRSARPRRGRRPRTRRDQRRCASGPCFCPTGRWPTGVSSTPSAACGRWRGWRPTPGR
jgi:protein-tyrosine phosphatase